MDAVINYEISLHSQQINFSTNRRKLEGGERESERDIIMFFRRVEF